MTAYILRRLLATIPVMAVVAMFVFFLLRLAPGDPAAIIAVRLGWLPVQGYRPLSEGILPFVEGLVLPSLALGLTYMALIARITRASMLEVLSEDYIRTARSKGLATRRVLMLHALKNAAV